MERPFQQIEVEERGNVSCVRLKRDKFDERGWEELGAEIARLVDENACYRIVLILGPEDPHCLYSVFLAKLVNLQRRLDGHGGALVLAQLSSVTQKIFQVAGLEKFFRFNESADGAVRELAGK